MRTTSDGFDLANRHDHMCPADRCGATMTVEIVNLKGTTIWFKDTCQVCGTQTEVYGVGVTREEMDELHESLGR